MYQLWGKPKSCKKTKKTQPPPPKKVKKPKTLSKKKNPIKWRYNQLRRWNIAMITLVEMFKMRGYAVNPTFFKRLTHLEFKHIVLDHWINNIGFVFDVPKHGAQSPTKVCFYRSETVGINDMRSVLDKLEPCVQVILVVTVPCKPAVHNYIMCNSSKVKIEIFTLDELSFNLLQHSLVPHHRLLSSKEVKKLLQRFKLPSVNVFNKILVTDPVARFYGVDVGHVFEIERPTPEGHSFKTWRVVSRVPLK